MVAAMRFLLPSKKCRNCPNKACRPRQLCQRCYNDLSIRVRYPSLSKFGTRDKELTEIDPLDCCSTTCNPDTAPTDQSDWLRSCFGGSLSLAPLPTTALPGSSEKKAVMAERYREGFQLFHPDDASWADAGELQLVCQLLEQRQQLEAEKQLAQF